LDLGHSHGGTHQFHSQMLSSLRIDFVLALAYACIEDESQNTFSTTNHVHIQVKKTHCIIRY